MTRGRRIHGGRGLTASRSIRPHSHALIVGLSGSGPAGLRAHMVCYQALTILLTPRPGRDRVSVLRQPVGRSGDRADVSRLGRDAGWSCAVRSSASRLGRACACRSGSSGRCIWHRWASDPRRSIVRCAGGSNRGVGRSPGRGRLGRLRGCCGVSPGSPAGSSKASSVAPSAPGWPAVQYMRIITSMVRCSLRTRRDAGLEEVIRYPARSSVRALDSARARAAR